MLMTVPRASSIGQARALAARSLYLTLDRPNAIFPSRNRDTASWHFARKRGSAPACTRRHFLSVSRPSRTTSARHPATGRTITAPLVRNDPRRFLAT